MPTTPAPVESSANGSSTSQKQTSTTFPGGRRNPSKGRRLAYPKGCADGQGRSRGSSHWWMPETQIPRPSSARDTTRKLSVCASPADCAPTNTFWRRSGMACADCSRAHRALAREVVGRGNLWCTPSLRTPRLSTKAQIGRGKGRLLGSRLPWERRRTISLRGWSGMMMVNTRRMETTQSV